MTVIIKVECDADGCHATKEINDNHPSDIDGNGWRHHPYDSYQHYCPSCWPIVEKEIAEESEE